MKQGHQIAPTKKGVVDVLFYWQNRATEKTGLSKTKEEKNR